MTQFNASSFIRFSLLSLCGLASLSDAKRLLGEKDATDTTKLTEIIVPGTDDCLVEFFSSSTEASEDDDIIATAECGEQDTKVLHHLLEYTTNKDAVELYEKLAFEHMVPSALNKASRFFHEQEHKHKHHHNERALSSPEAREEVRNLATFGSTQWFEEEFCADDSSYDAHSCEIDQTCSSNRCKLGKKECKKVTTYYYAKSGGATIKIQSKHEGEWLNIQIKNVKEGNYAWVSSWGPDRKRRVVVKGENDDIEYHTSIYWQF
jgi:hypothetical protein